ncbi:MAG: FAD binding domain-containing protein [Pseudolabrys sp.]
MKPAPFKYVAPGSLDEALTLKAAHGEDARFLAGGQSLVPTLNFRLAQPSVIIDINLLSGLSGIQRQNGHALCIGALTRYRALERDPLVADTLPLVHEALPHIAHPQIRNRGTMGGNIAHADPASELPAIVLALGGQLRVQSATGSRWIEARDFFLAQLTTALEPDEMLVEIELPARTGRSGFCFMEVARRRGDFALMGRCQRDPRRGWLMRRRPAGIVRRRRDTCGCERCRDVADRPAGGSRRCRGSRGHRAKGN